MPLTIVKSDGSNLVTVADGTANQDYSVGFAGNNYKNYGTIVNKNFLTLLENSASSTQPLRPITGQLWYDKTGSGVLKVYDGTQFKPLAEFYYANSVSSPATGDLWFNPDDSTFKVYNGSSWTTLSPTPLPIAGTGAGGVLGGVKIGTGLSINSTTGLVDAAQVATYKLPIASVGATGVLGGVMIDPTTIDINSGVISVKSGYTLPTATVGATGVLGGVKIGNGLAINAGVVSVNLAGTDLPKATQTSLGAVKVGTGLSVDGTGLLTSTVSAYTLPKATPGATGVLGGIRVGNNLSIDPSTGILSNNVFPYKLPAATDKALGGIMVGTGLTINPSTGALDLAASTLPVATVGASGVLGGVKIGSGLKIDAVTGVAALKLGTGLTFNASGELTGPGGNSGATGAVGGNGARGATGVTGASGATGTVGATGATGIRGYLGSLGATGITGATGGSGTRGATGGSGTRGTVGVTGFTGSVGATGTITGVTGYRGSAGSPAAGAPGFTGSVGAQGVNTGPLVTGLIGYTGSAGELGTIGNPGAAGSIGTVRGATGVPGTGGSIGVDGYRGSVGAIGPQGLRGSPGVGGASKQGVTGATGGPGLTGVRGATGITGAVASPGRISLDGINFILLRFPEGASGATGATGVTGLRGGIGATGVQPDPIPAPVTSVTVITDRGVTLVDSATGAVTFNLPTAANGSDITGILGGVKAWGAFRAGFSQTKSPTSTWFSTATPPVGGWLPDPTKAYNFAYYAVRTTANPNPQYYGPTIGWGKTHGTGIYPDGLPVNPLLPDVSNASEYGFPSSSTSYSINNLTSITYHGVGLYTINLTNGPNLAAGELYPIVLIQHTQLPAMGSDIGSWALINSEAGRGGDGKVTKLYVGSVTANPGSPISWQDGSGSIQFIVIW